MNFFVLGDLSENEDDEVVFGTLPASEAKDSGWFNMQIVTMTIC